MILQQLWQQAKTTKRMQDNINETVMLHCDALCHLVETYDCDSDQVQDATDVLDKIGKALDVANSLPDSPSRTQYINRINDLLSKVREQIKDMVDCIKNPTNDMDNDSDDYSQDMGDEENEEHFSMDNQPSNDMNDSDHDFDMDSDDSSDEDDQTSQIDAFLDKFLSDIEQSMSGGDGDFDEDDGYSSDDMDSDSDDQDFDTDSDGDDDFDQDNNSDDMQYDEPKKLPGKSNFEPQDENEEMSERKRRFGNYRMGTMRNTCEGQKSTFSNFLMETQMVAPTNPMLDTHAQYCVFYNKDSGPEKIAGPFSMIEAKNWVRTNKLQGSPLIHIDVQQPSDV